MQYLRYAAIKYCTTSYSPRYLLKSVVEFGVNFGTFEAVNDEVRKYISLLFTDIYI